MSTAGKSGKYSDLKLRIASAIALAVIGALAVFQGQPSVAILASVIVVLMIHEYREMVAGSVSPRDPGFWVMGVAVVLAVFLASFHSVIFSVITIGAGVLALFVVDRKHFLWMAFGLVYLGLASTMFTSLRNWPSEGVWAVVWIASVVIAADVGGYFAGRTFGGPKLWPAVSPKKTWSGIIGGWVLAFVVGVIFHQSGTLLTIPYIVPLSVVLAVASQAGDLLESAAKRHFGIKDSSALIPGHGGLLDRFDGQLAAFVLFSLLTLAGLI